MNYVLTSQSEMKSLRGEEVSNARLQFAHDRTHDVHLQTSTNPTAPTVLMVQQMLDVREGEQLQHTTNKIKIVEVPPEGSLW